MRKIVWNFTLCGLNFKLYVWDFTELYAMVKECIRNPMGLIRDDVWNQSGIGPEWSGNYGLHTQCEQNTYGISQIRINTIYQM